jgi:dTDP-4-amino-4,6-dideoxygalactose transaminase
MVKNMCMELVNCTNQYWEFVRKLRMDSRVIDGFLQTNPITEVQHTNYMCANSQHYRIALIDGKPAGYVGVIDDDIRVCTHPDFQGMGVGKFMIEGCMNIWPNAHTKVKIGNTSCNKLFISCGFTVSDRDNEFTYYKLKNKMVSLKSSITVKEKYVSNILPFNKPYLSGKELEYIAQAINSGKISGNGIFTKKCQDYFEKNYGFKKALLTSSCTDALEMCAILCDLMPGDEVIVPSYTFVSSALAFVREGAKVIFADSCSNNPNIDTDKIESLITKKTKVIVVVHYAGIACDMDKVMNIADRYGIIVIEDAAQAIDSFYKGKSLGSIGHMSAFSFHETKNIISGEGGLLAINDNRFLKRAEIIWEKGTNRAEFFRGEVNKYNWVDKGSSFLPSELTSAFLWAQLENLNMIQSKRRMLWEEYYKILKSREINGNFKLPFIPDYATNNAHIFYLICNNYDVRSNIINKLKSEGIISVFHYLSLHKSPYYNNMHDGRILENSDMFSDCLIRLPLFYELEIEEINKICNLLPT